MSEASGSPIMPQNGISKHAPKWVNPESVGLDQFFTEPTAAKRCLDSLLAIIERDGANVRMFVEPSAGSGAFFRQLPEGKRIGLDIEPLCDGVSRRDFLEWEPETPFGLAFVGNPPFGSRSWLALAFLNHAARFADYAGFILPMAFASDGKGSPKHRVSGMELVHSEPLGSDIFSAPDGRKRKVHAVWQVWRRGENKRPAEPSCSEWADIFAMDARKERLCGQGRMAEADLFVQRSFFGKAPFPVASASGMRHADGYGIAIKKDKAAVMAALAAADWTALSNGAAHGARHIGMHHIRKALADAGFSDQNGAAA